ncbi:MAG: hypothetical protein D6686_11400 [Alphaproteobacteria bacterium]|nr:MAG: hypothetical protein D6686_11400 [Alphaproteobacteria bacterium]
MADPRALIRRAGPWGWLARAMTTPSAPTADLYIANACADWLADGRLHRIGPTLFATADAQLVIRHDARAPLGFGRPRSLFLIDDAWWAAGQGLSAWYRLKTRLVEGGAARHWLSRAEAVVVSSGAIARGVRERCPAPVHVIDPYWSEPLADLAHFDAGPTRLAFLGAQLHGPDLDWIAPVLRHVLDDCPGVTLALSSGHALPPPLAGHPSVRRLAPLRWRDWRAALPGMRFHIALYPLQPTPFNAARSRNKVIEHAIVGAAPLVADIWPAGREAAAQGAAIALPHDRPAWEAALRALIADRDRQRRIAAAARDHARRINRPDAQRALWARLLRPGPVAQKGSTFAGQKR